MTRTTKSLSLAGLLIPAIVLGPACDDIYYNRGAPEFTFNELIDFDTTVYIFARQTVGGKTYSEMAQTWEHSFGEPFTDNNGNGVYDAGDGFILDPDPAINQDLDRNGEYTPPDHIPWLDGVPFDDINGDDFCTQAFDDPFAYGDGFAYCDFNGNHRFDSSLDYRYIMTAITADFYDSNRVGYRFEVVYPWYTFLSDSGYTYNIPDTNYTGTQIYEFFEFIVTDSQLSFYYPSFTLPLVTPRNLANRADTELVVEIGGYEHTLKRTLTPGQSLTIDDHNYGNLLLISCRPDAVDADDREYVFVDCYFDRGRGLIAVIFDLSLFTNSINYNYFDRRYDSLPLSMRK